MAFLQENKLELSADSAQRFLYYNKEKGFKPATLNRYIDLLGNLDKFYESQGKPINISSGLKRFTVEKQAINVLTYQEVDRLINTRIKFPFYKQCWVDQDELLLTLTMALALTGCRYSEMQTLKVENVTIDSGKILIPKSKNGTFRFVFLPPEAMNRLRPYLKDKSPSDYVFTTAKGGLIYDSHFLKNLQKRAVQCGINKKMYPHLLRHSFCTELLTSGVPIEQVAMLMGHSSTEVTYSTYAHLSDTTLQKSLYRHPLFKKETPPQDIIRGLVEAFKSFKLDADDRFKYTLSEGQNGLDIKVILS